MDLEKLVKNIVLKSGEITAKGASLPLGIVTLGSDVEGVTGKYVDGVKSTPEVIGKSLKYMLNFSEMNDNYNNLTAKEFVNTYEAMGWNKLAELNNYLMQTGNNLMDNPVETLIASGLTAGSAYLAGRAAKFVRTEGQGTIIQKIERKLGDKAFGR